MGLAIARQLAQGGQKVVLLERNEHVGQETSARNSEGAPWTLRNVLLNVHALFNLCSSDDWYAAWQQCTCTLF